MPEGVRLGLDSDLTTADTASPGGAVGRATGHVNQKVGGSNPPRGAYFLALFDVIYIYSKLNLRYASDVLGGLRFPAAGPLPAII